MKIKHFPCLLYLAALLFTASSCTNMGHPPQDVEEEIITTLDWYINFSWFTTTWEENAVTDAITQASGTKINFITPSGNEWEKLNSMMNSDTLPDMITLGQWEPAIKQIVSSGQAYALNELADKYEPYFFQVANPLRLAWYTEPDGNTYAYPNSSYTPGDYEIHPNIGSNQTFLVRNDIYEILGRPDMTTPEGFKAALLSSKEFLSIDGEPLIPIGLYDFDKDGCFSLEGILMNLLAVPFEENGKFYDRHSHPDYMAWLKVFNELWREGCFPDDIFLDRRVQTVEKASQGRYFCMLYQYTDIADQQIMLYEKHPESRYIAVDGPKNANGDDHRLPGVGINGWTVTMISKNCKNPEKAIKLMTYLMSEEGQKVTYCGVSGITYDEIDGKPVIKPEVLEVLNRDRMEYNRLYGADNTYWMLQDKAMQLNWEPEPREPVAQPRQWTYPYTVYTAQYDIIFDTGSEAANAHVNIREAWGETLPKLIAAGSEEAFDNIFADYFKKRGELGFDMVMEESTRLMIYNKERLNILN